MQPSNQRFSLSAKYEWNTNEWCIGRSILWYVERHQAMSNSEKIEHVAGLAIVELH